MVKVVGLPFLGLLLLLGPHSSRLFKLGIQMNAGPNDQARHPADPPEPPRSVWLRVFRAAIVVVVFWFLWLLYPIVWVRLCASRVESFYELQPAMPNSNERFISRPTADTSSRQQWEENLGKQPISRLLSMLSTEDSKRVWVVSVAIEQQLRQGKLVGWPGKRDPVPPLDLAATQVILAAADQDLAQPAIESLLRLLELAIRNQPQNKELLLRATENRQPMIRCFGIRVLEILGLDSEAAVELVHRLARDSDPTVRERLCGYLVSAIRSRGPQSIPESMHTVLRSAFEDENSGVQMKAMESIEFLDLEADATITLLARLLNESDDRVRTRSSSKNCDASLD